MRILRLFFIWFMILLVVGGGGFLLVREMWLAIAVNQVKSNISTMNRSSLRAGQPALECQPTGRPTGDELTNVYQVQLAFIDDRQYQWEVICDSSLRDPIVLQRFELPVGVTKAAGSAGLVVGDFDSNFTLELWGRQSSIVLDGREVSTQNGPLSPSVQQPVTVCEGRGFSCCALDSEVGVGTQTTAVRDCPRSCFAQCVRRPVILSLYTQPMLDPQSREVRIAPGETVTFSYVLDGASLVSSVLSFGDGEQSQSTESSVTTTHVYSCATSECLYTVQLQAIDEAGNTAATSGVSQVTVRVTTP